MRRSSWGSCCSQDVTRSTDGDRTGDVADDGRVSLKDGVSKDQMVSVHDPGMRRGHKCKSKRYDGHKDAVVVDTDTQLVTAVDVLPGNAPDNLGALGSVEQSEASAGVPVSESMGDTAYGDGSTRQAFVYTGRKLVARVPGWPNRKHFPKEDFIIDLMAGTCNCPAGQATRTIVPAGKRSDSTGTVYRIRAFRFEAAVCWTCPLRSPCIAAKGRKGRQVLIHPQEALLQEVPELQQSADFDQYRRRRVVADHPLARLEQLGIRQASYFGQDKTKVQLYLAARVANLTLLANQTGFCGEPGEYPDSIVTTAPIGVNRGVDRHLLPTWMLAWLRSPTLALSPWTGACREGIVLQGQVAQLALCPELDVERELRRGVVGAGHAFDLAGKMVSLHWRSHCGGWKTALRTTVDTFLGHQPMDAEEC